MKNIFLAIAIFAILLSSCRNKSTINTDTHIHEDGTEHVNHDTGLDEAPEQEVFDVEIDSLTTEKDSLKSEHEEMHSHDGGQNHKH